MYKLTLRVNVTNAIYNRTTHEQQNSACTDCAHQERQIKGALRGPPGSSIFLRSSPDAAGNPRASSRKCLMPNGLVDPSSMLRGRANRPGFGAPDWKRNSGPTCGAGGISKQPEQQGTPRCLRARRVRPKVDARRSSSDCSWPQIGSSPKWPAGGI